MQHLFMMATMIRENQLKTMATEILSGLISIEQAMINYNVYSAAIVINRVEIMKEKNEREALRNQSESADLNVLAA